jgi:pyruvate formate lyase activating enzyme
VSASFFNGVCGLNKFAGNDFPGIVSAILFYSGCNLRCPYCHNPDIATGKISDFNPEEIDVFLQKRKGIIDGIVITGGEPTIHKNLPALTKYIHDSGYAVKLDTNGLKPEILKECVFDYLALDIKTAPKKYVEYLGAKLSPEKIREHLFDSISYIKKYNGELRITVAPKIIEDSDFAEIAEFFEDMPVFLQNFRTRFDILDKDFFVNENSDKNLTMKLKDYLEKSAKIVKIREYAENSKVSDKKYHSV